MEYQEGYVYHIKDEYFIKANDSNLILKLENLMLKDALSSTNL